MKFEFQMMLVLGGTVISAPVMSQTDRELAVAIDRVEVPRKDDFTVEQIGSPLARPWSMAFLPDGRIMITEKHGGIRMVSKDGTTSQPLKNGPQNVYQNSDSGLLDIVLDPNFKSNKLVYVAFAEGTEKANRTALWKARLDGHRFEDSQVIFRINEEKTGPSHPGGRLLFLHDNTLLLSVGDGYDHADKAQDPASHFGKVLRLTDEGKAALDNPFVEQKNYAPEIYTMGHRNIQGMTLDKATGIVWSHEHGPRGGDEVNQLEPGKNYGWPRASFGIDYDGSIVSERNHAEGLARPHYFWAPSIAPSGLAVYRGQKFADWDGHFLVGGLRSKSLIQLEAGKQTGLLVERGRWLEGLDKRIRDVRVSPDGDVYLLTDEEEGRLLRLVAPIEKQNAFADSPLAPLTFMIGDWDTESRYTPPFLEGAKTIYSTGTISCKPHLNMKYVRCSSNQKRSDGRSRQIEEYFRHKPEDNSFESIILYSSSSTQSRHPFTWDKEEQALIGFLKAEVRGQSASERITLKSSADGNQVTYREAYRLDDDPDAVWSKAYHSIWKRRP